MLSTALIVCQDILSVVCSGSRKTTEEYELDQVIVLVSLFHVILQTSGIQNLCQVGLKNFILVIISPRTEVEKSLSRCIQNYIPDASISFIRISDWSVPLNGLS